MARHPAASGGPQVVVDQGGYRDAPFQDAREVSEGVAEDGRGEHVGSAGSDEIAGGDRSRWVERFECNYLINSPDVGSLVGRNLCETWW